MDETLTLRPSKGKWIFVATTLAALAGLFAVVYPSAADDASRWFLAGCAALSLVGAVFATRALTGAAYLRLTREGFEARNLTGTTKRRFWIEVEGFSPVNFRGTSVVMFRRAAAGRAEPSALDGVQRRILGGEENLPDTYGLPAEALADLMNEWRKGR